MRFFDLYPKSVKIEKEILAKKLSRTNDILSKLRYYVPKENFTLDLIHSVQIVTTEINFTKKSDGHFCSSEKYMRLLTFSDYRENNCPIFKSFKILKLLK